MRCVFVLGLVLSQQVFAGRSFASVNLMERPEEELLILELYVNDEIRSAAILGYLPLGAPLAEALYPLYSLSKALSLAIKVDPAAGNAEGWLYEEHNVFQLDLSRNIVVVNGQERPLPQGAAEPHFDDIYVQASYLEEWLDINLRSDLTKLKMFVTGGDRLFPFEAEEARKKRGEGLDGGAGSKGVQTYDSETLLPYQWVVPPSFVWQQTLQARRVNKHASADTSFSLQTYGDVLKSESRFIFSGTTGTGDRKTELSTARGYFQRRDPGEEMLGPLHAGRVAAGDVTYPDVPLIVGRKRGRGLLVSSKSDLRLVRSYGDETYDLDGDAPVGWDVELYRNGYYVAFQTVGIDGRYNFEDVVLVRGYNLFQIVMYGPEGQKRTETQRVVRGQEMLPEGEMEYEFAGGQPDADFLPIAENARRDKTLGASGHVTYGVKNYLSVGGSFFTGADDRADSSDKRLSAVSGSAVVAMLGLKLEGLTMLANEGRSAYEAGVSTRVSGANISASHTRNNGFDEDDRNLVSRSAVNVNRNFGAFSANIEAAKDTYQKKEDEIVLNGNVSTRIAGVSVSNSMEKVISDSESQEAFDGKVSLATDVIDWRLRGELQYDLDKNVRERMRNASISAYKKLTRTSTMRVNTGYDFSNDIINADARYSMERDKYSLDFTVGGSTQNDYYGSLTLRTGFKPDVEGKYQLVSAKDAGLGAVALRAYLDQNGNRAYDMGEKLLPNITFRSNKGLVDEQTDQDGVVFVRGLSEGLTRFELEEASLPSIYMKPYDDHVDIIPRSGATTMLYMGFEQLGEIDGFIYAATAVEGEENTAYPGVDVLLIDQASGEELFSVTSEYDGYYVFPAIPLGLYQVQAVPMWDEEDIFGVEVEITQDKPIATDRNIVMPQRVASAGDGIALASVTGYPDVRHEIFDEPLPVVTDGLDIATGEPLRGIFLHFSSMSSYEGALDKQKQLWAKYDILKGVPIYIYKISVGDKVFYRVVGAVKDYDEAQKIYNELLMRNAPEECNFIEL